MLIIHMLFHPYSLLNASCLSFFSEVSLINSVVRNYPVYVKLLAFNFKIAVPSFLVEHTVLILNTILWKA